MRIPHLYLLLVFALTAFTGCRGRAPEPASEAAAPTTPVVHPTRQNLTRRIQQPGWVRAYEQTPIYSKIPGFVERIDVDINSRVKEHDLLLSLWVPELEQDYNAKKARVTQAEAEVVQASEGLLASTANVATSEALLKEAEAGVEQANRDFLRWTAEYDRAGQLLKERIFDKQTLDEAANQMGQSKAGVAKAVARKNSAAAALDESKARKRKADADLAAARARVTVATADRDSSLAWLNYREIRAPYDGVITARNVHRGHFLQSSSSGTTNPNAEPLFQMVRMDKMRINVQVPEYDAVLVKTGMPAVVRFPGTTVPEQHGAVTLFTWVVDEQARTLRAEIHLDNPKELLRPGLFASVVIAAELPNLLVLPVESLMNEGDAYYCYVIEGGKAVRTAVDVGVKTDRLVQVLRKQERHVGDPKNDHWQEFTGREDIVARNPTALVDGQAISVER